MKHPKGAAIALALTTSLFLAACGGDEGEGDSSGSDTIRVTLANHVWTDTIKEAIPQFEEETGLTVEITQLGEDQLSDQYNVKLNAGSEDLDVMMYRPLQEGKLFATNGWMADLTERVESNADWDWSDFQEGPKSATTHEDTVVGVPIITEREVLYYRKDLLEKSGYDAPPQTLDELKEMALKIKQDNPGTAGFVARTARTAAVTQFSSYLFSYGGDFEVDGQAAVGSDEAIAAYDMYSSLIREAGPENVSTDMGWPDSMAIFQQGQAAFLTEADSLYRNATDPEKSKVAENVGFAPFPEGPAGRRSYNIPSWALGINEGSQNKDNAWKFIEWATSQEQALALQQAGNPSARNSVWENAESTKNDPADLVEASKGSAENGVGHDRPLVTRVAEAREIVGQPIVDGITGKDVAESAQTAQEAFQQFLDSE
ncbi:ABC transporter substrate-binding protein [Tessaracoccus oleiagri]|uniref:Multiple sugar transport system substrate-binding protein n=1 Tax=Tessaracoccus oleiagri TaxID=686624 RepID=A0A1G9H2F4_9ACTN|nr:sugar ABC transporter substrate-binding protein [Tessaracoccus oleiagri]SDL07005.1 multiple sugar transport system substrate-binding protein [Tessaracoccus oleiagri]